MYLQTSLFVSKCLWLQMVTFCHYCQASGLVQDPGKGPVQGPGQGRNSEIKIQSQILKRKDLE